MDELLAKVKSAQYMKLVEPELHYIVSPQYVIDLRDKLNMGQLTFSHMMGVDEEEVELWEEDWSSIPEIAAKLMYLLAENEGLSEQLYKTERGKIE